MTEQSDQISLSASPKEYLEELFVVPHIHANTGVVMTHDEKVDMLYLSLQRMSLIDLPVTHRITPGLYTRQCDAPAGTLLISKTHLHKHQFILSKGRMHIVNNDGVLQEVVAPFHGITEAGTRRVAYIDEDVIMTTMHVTDETDIAKIEAEIFMEDQLKVSDNPDHVDFLEAAKDIGLTPEEIRIYSGMTHTMTDMPEGFGLKIEVKPSSIHGLGMFAKEDIADFELIAPAALKGLRTPAGRYVNHSVHPNSMLHVEPDGQVNLVSVVPITQGTEITLDYRQSQAAAIEASLILKIQ